MKVTCQRDGLQAACRLVSAAVAAHTTIPALKNIKATAQDDSLLLVGYDPTQGVGIRYELRGVTVRRAGSCILPKDQLTQILAECAEPDVTLDADGKAVVATAGGRYEMLSLDVNEFPDFPAFDDGGRYHEVSAGALRTLIKRTAFAADKKDSTAKFQLQALLWEAEGAEARLIATDTKRLAVGRGPAAAFGPPADGKAVHLVPAKALALLERTLADDEEPVRVALRASDALFRTERATVYAALSQGRFPPYRDIIAKTRKAATQTVALPVSAFLARMRQAAIMADDESKRVDVTFEPGKVTMQARGAKTGSSEVSFELPDYAGPTTEISFDPQYVVEYLKALGDEPTVTLAFDTGKSPVLFTCGAAHEYLVMPLTG